MDISTRLADATKAHKCNLCNDSLTVHKHGWPGYVGHENTDNVSCIFHRHCLAINFNTEASRKTPQCPTCHTRLNADSLNAFVGKPNEQDVLDAEKKARLARGQRFQRIAATTRTPAATTRTPAVTSIPLTATTGTPAATSRTLAVTTRTPVVTSIPLTATTGTPAATSRTLAVTSRTPVVTSIPLTATTGTPAATSRTLAVTTRTPVVTSIPLTATAGTPAATSRTLAVTSRTPAATTATAYFSTPVSIPLMATSREYTKSVDNWNATTAKHKDPVPFLLKLPMAINRCTKMKVKTAIILANALTPIILTIAAVAISFIISGLLIISIIAGSAALLAGIVVAIALSYVSNEELVKKMNYPRKSV